MNNLLTRRNDLVNQALSYIAKSASLCKQHLDVNEEVPAAFQELNDCVEQYCTQDIKFTAFKNALEKTETTFEDIENAPDVSVQETFKKFHTKEKVVINKDAISQHPFMINYIRDIQEAELEKDVEVAEEGVVGNIFVPPIDPITKTAIKNPVRNTQCGHVYENDSICALINKKNTRCPYIGCPALQYIQPTYLQPDKNLKKKIEHYFINNN